ncbi:MAG: DUF4166 domain-containing protein [bacterium]|nr:DUF4166 domain-containing protein [bacterium]
MVHETETGGGGRAFPETRWSLILGARGTETTRRAALEELLAAYWKPLYLFTRKNGLSVDAAKDAVQDFALRMLEKDVLVRVDPDRGRFRSFLRVALQNHLHNRRAAQAAGKRRRGHLEVELHARVEDGALCITSGRQRVKLGPLRIPLPRWFVGEANVREWREGPDRLGIRVTIKNPILGAFFGYTGSFAAVA